MINLVNRFSERFFQWQLYAHYLLLAIILNFFISFITSFDNLWTSIVQMFNIKNILTSTFLLFVADTIVHAIFWFAKKPIQWRD